MIYYKIQASNPDSANQIIRTLKNSHTWAKVNGNPLEIFSATGNDHTSHVTGIAQEFNATVSQINKEQIPVEIKAKGGIPRREYLAFDGTPFTDKMLLAGYNRSNNPELVNTRHDRWKSLTRKPRSAKTAIVHRIEPNQDFNLAGVINSLDALEGRLLEAYNQVSEAKAKLIKVNDIEKLLRDRDEYLRSAKAVLASVG